MGMKAESLRMFQEPLPETPPWRPTPPMPRRRFLRSLLLPGTVAAAGGLGLLIRAVLNGHGHPVPRPGPRRYPPGYHRPRERPPG